MEKITFSTLLIMILKLTKLKCLLKYIVQFANVHLSQLFRNKIWTVKY